jgi:hypothetical protein
MPSLRDEARESHCANRRGTRRRQCSRVHELPLPRLLLWTCRTVGVRPGSRVLEAAVPPRRARGPWWPPLPEMSRLRQLARPPRGGRASRLRKAGRVRADRDDHSAAGVPMSVLRLGAGTAGRVRHLQPGAYAHERHRPSARCRDQVDRPTPLVLAQVVLGWAGAPITGNFRWIALGILVCLLVWGQRERNRRK